MALNTQLQDMPAWMSRSSDWTQRQPNQFTEGLRLAVAAKQHQQNQALEARALILREQQMEMMNQHRLEQMNEAALEMEDAPLLAEYAKNPDAGVPNFKSPKSYSRLGEISLAHSRTEAQRAVIAARTELNKRLAKLSFDDAAEARKMQADGASEYDIRKFVTTAEKRSTRNFAPPELQKVIDLANQAEADGDLELAELYRKRADVIANGGKIVTGKMSDIDNAEYRRLNTRLNVINKQTQDFKGSGDAARQLRKEREGIESELGAIKQKYSEAPSVIIGGPEGKPELPKAGDVRNGYKFNGKFPPGDRRAWDAVE